MHAEQRFRFDCQGYAVVPGALSPALVERFAREMRQRLARRAPARDGTADDPLVDVLAWAPEMAALIDLPAVLPVLRAVLGPRFRLDHEYAIALQPGEGRGPLHGGEGGMPDWWYRCQDGVIRTGMASVVLALTDAGPGAGGFCCIPGSHKSGCLRQREDDDRSGFLEVIPEAVRTFAASAEYVVQPVLHAGDAVVFTEALVHGTQPWRGEGQRLAVLLKYTPGHCVAAGPRAHGPDPQWLSPRQRTLLAGPGLYGRAPIPLDP